MVFLPEACDFIGEKRSHFVENAEPANGETVRSFCLLAEQNKVWLSLGGVLEKVNNIT
jgi:predicted amidohydrolase